jgi:hypothetical protein
LYELQGIGRGLHSWTDFSGNVFKCVGTTFKYYVVVGTEAYDITPISLDLTGGAALTDPITTDGGGGDPELVTVDCGTTHSATVNDFVVFNSLDTMPLDGMTEDDFITNREGFQIHEIVDDQTFKVKITGATSGLTAQTGGGSVELVILVSSGSLASVTGSGFGSGTFGGDDYHPDIFTIQSPYVTTTGGGSNVVTIHTVGVGGCTFQSSPSLDMIYPIGLSGTINGFDTSYLNNKWWAATGPGDAIIDVGYAIAGAGGTGGTGGTFYAYDNTVLSVVGATRGWNDGSDESVVTNKLRTVSIHNFGEDLIFANRGGPLYYFDVSANTNLGTPNANARALQINGTNFAGSTGAPDVVDGFTISEGHGHAIAWGCNDFGDPGNQNKMLIRWSDRHNPFNWTPSAVSESGGDILRHGSMILGAVPTKDEVLFFTDGAVYAMRFVGYPEIYGISLITENVTAFSRMSAVAVDNSVYFMGNEQFYVYNGNVEPLPKKISSFVFDNMNLEQRQKVFAGVNSAFTEVFWFYPDGDSFECNRYVSYNYSTGAWGMGSFDMASLTEGSGGSTSYNRTAWQDSGIFDNPVSSYVLSYLPNNTPETQKSALMTHEKGTTAQGGTIEHYAETGEVDLAEGDRYAFYDKIIPDIEVFDVNDGVNGEINIDLIGRDLPGKDPKAPASVMVQFTSGSDEYTPDFNKTTVRGRGRTVSLKVRSNASGFGWRMGDMRVRIRPDGRD